VHAAFELSDQVFLVATVVGLEDDLVGWGGAVVGDEKEVAILFKRNRSRSGIRRL